MITSDLNYNLVSGLDRNYTKICNGYRELTRQDKVLVTPYRNGWSDYIDPGHTLVPFYVNDLNIRDEALTVDTSALTKDTCKRQLDIIANSINDEYAVVNIFTADDDACTLLGNVSEIDISNNMFGSFKNTLNNIIHEDNREAPDYTLRVFKHNAKHIMYLVHNIFEDKTQRQFYIGYAMMPYIFTELQEKFNTIEMEYFAEFRHQLILKRMAKSKVKEILNQLIRSEKYTNKFDELNLAVTVNNVINERLQQLRTQQRRQYEEVKSSLRQYSQMVANYNRTSEELVQKEAQRETAIEEYKNIFNQPFIKDLNVSGNDLYFRIEGGLDFYDEDLLDCYLNGNHNEDFERFLIAVFKENRFKINSFGGFRFKLNANNGDRTYELPMQTRATSTALCNPHLYHFSCLGNYAPLLARAQGEGDLLTFTNIALASVRSLNFADGAVLRRFEESFIESKNYGFRDTFGNTPYIEDAEGNKYTVGAIMNKLDKELLANESSNLEEHEVERTEETNEEAEFIW